MMRDVPEQAPTERKATLTMDPATGSTFGWFPDAADMLCVAPDLRI